MTQGRVAPLRHENGAQTHTLLKGRCEEIGAALNERLGVWTFDDGIENGNVPPEQGGTGGAL